MILDIIEKKKNKQPLSYEELKYVVDEYLNDNIKDYQMSSLLMAITINGMNDEEVINLTEIMKDSGQTLDLSKINGVVVDKHSTGGVGDKTTLVLIPLIASCGVNIGKMSGRGLGYTGGTIDKFESISGFRTTMKLEEFIDQINKIKVAEVGQMLDLAPADKKIYALRDVTGTVDSIPLIASSIMSKKLACGSSIILIDVKVGNGALAKTIEQAKELSRLMIKIGKKHNKKIVCILTNMDEPLGYAVGNALEVIESIETLKGHGPKDLEKLVIEEATILVSLAKNQDKETSKKEVINNLKNMNAYKKFEELVKFQGGDINKIKVSDKVFSIKSKKTGFIDKINTVKIGELAKKIGAGRMNKDDKIDYTVGMVLSKKVGDYILKDEELLKVYLSDKDVNVNEVLECFEIKELSDNKKPLIEDIIWQ